MEGLVLRLEDMLYWSTSSGAMVEVSETGSGFSTLKLNLGGEWVSMLPSRSLSGTEPLEGGVELPWW